MKNEAKSQHINSFNLAHTVQHRSLLDFLQPSRPFHLRVWASRAQLHMLRALRNR